jgi:hypothetical protein
MRRETMLLALGLAVAIVAFARLRRAHEPSPVSHRFPETGASEPSPIVPWREPARDLAVFFPGATNHLAEERIITGLLVPARKRLGRPLHPDENPLRIYRVFGGMGHAGSILVSRAKGEYGGIEIVLGVETNGAVRGVRIQSQREPLTVAEAITATHWLEGFRGKTAESSLQLGADIPEVPVTARASAQAIADTVRSQLVILQYAEMPVEARELGRLPDEGASHARPRAHHD